MLILNRPIPFLCDCARSFKNGRKVCPRIIGKRMRIAILVRSGPRGMDCPVALDKSQADQVGTMNTPNILERDVLNIAPPTLPPARLENNTAVEIVVGKIERNKIPIRNSGSIYSAKRLTSKNAKMGITIKLNIWTKR